MTQTNSTNQKIELLLENTSYWTLFSVQSSDQSLIVIRYHDHLICGVEKQYDQKTPKKRKNHQKYTKYSEKLLSCVFTQWPQKTQRAFEKH